MTAVSNDGNIIKRTSQYIDNQAFDETTGLPTVQLGGTDGVNVTRLKINSDGSINAVTGVSTTYKTKVDKATTNIIYIGKAVIGTATSAASWLITKVDKTVTDNVTITYAAAGASTATWDNRASETYS